MIAIALADDHQVVTHSLQAYLESFPDLKVVGIAATGEELARASRRVAARTSCFRIC